MTGLGTLLCSFICCLSFLLFCKPAGTLLGVLSIYRHRLGDMEKAVGILIFGVKSA